MTAVPSPASPPDAEELARRLREVEAERDRVAARLRRLEGSRAVRLARAAARLRRWRPGRTDQPSPQVSSASAAVAAPPASRPRTATVAAARPAARPAAPEPLGSRLLGASALLVVPRDRPVLAVVAEPSVARRWADDALVQPLRPDDAAAVLAAIRPDVLVVHAGAGRSGPWAGFGGYEVPERDAAVLDLLRDAAERQVPAVLVGAEDGRPLPVLADAGVRFAGEVAWGAGVAEVLAAPPRGSDAGAAA